MDGFVCAVGTGGTLAGVGIALKERNPKVVIGLADPLGAALYNYYTNGELKAAGLVDHGRHRAGADHQEPGRRRPSTSHSRCPTRRRCRSSFRLLEDEGLCLGGSSGINVAGAIRLARHLGPGHTIVTILADYGTRYQSKLFNPQFLRSKNLPVPGWLERKSSVEPGLV